MNYEILPISASPVLSLSTQRQGVDLSYYLFNEIVKTDRLGDPLLLDFSLVPYDNPLYLDPLNSTRIQVTGGTTTNKYGCDVVNNPPSVAGHTYQYVLTVKNNNSRPLVIDFHTLRANITVNPGQETVINVTGTGNGVSDVQLNFATLLSSDTVDAFACNPAVYDLTNDPGATTNLIPAAHLDFSATTWAIRNGSVATLTQNANIGFASVKPQRGDYITFNTVTYGKWFTGFIANEPELTYLGMGVNRTPVWGYKFEATSDDYSLNLNPLGIVPPFLNTTQGEILRTLANKLRPNQYDLSNVQDGQQIARYIPDPTKRFADVVKEFCTSAQYRFWAQRLSLNFVPQDAVPCPVIVDATEINFSPDKLKVQSTQDPIVNDAIVLGGIEPQAYNNEYFVGDGETGEFPLAGSPFGVDSALLLDETFQGSTIDEQKWNVFDGVQGFLVPDSGFLNVLGGNQLNDLSVFLESESLIPLEGNLRITHGNWDFLPTGADGLSGVICGLWNGNPAVTPGSPSTYNGCFYGVEATRSGGVTTLRPIAANAVDTAQSQQIDTTLRYVIRTIVRTYRVFRSTQEWVYLGQDGTRGKIGGGGASDVARFTTVIAGINPQDGTTKSLTQWVNTFALDSSQVFAYYVPVASNDLHCTVNDITVSTPMQVQLSIKEPDSEEYDAKSIGPNEVEIDDSLAPVATITTNQQGPQQKSSLLGSPKYNLGNATLAFFNDPSTKSTTIPQKGEIIKVSYRQAGAALGRVQNPDSIASEAEAFGDNGLRSVTRKDLSPAPRTSAECEAAAASIVQAFSYTHFQGNYTVFSPGFGFVGEPTSGTVLQFRNLPATSFPVIPVDPGIDENGNPLPAPLYTSNFNEAVSQVKTTLLAGRPLEYFQHDLTFGAIDLVQKAIDRWDNSQDVFMPQDSAEIPVAVDVAAVGQANPDEVIAPILTNWDRNFFYFDPQQNAPVGGGFEIRYTDDSWGADDAKNLVLRTPSSLFTVPRSRSSKAVFVRAYDVRNKLLWSNDFTQAAWVKSAGVTVANQSDLDPDSNRTQISVITFANGGNVYQQSSVLGTNIAGCYTLDVKGSASQSILLRLTDSANGAVLLTQTVQLTGEWQRVSVAADQSLTGSVTGNIRCALYTNQSGPATLRVTRASLEVGRTTESVFCKTRSTPYGATSRFSSMVRVQFPGIPPAATAQIDARTITAPTVNVTLPELLDDVYGLEVRDADNATVLYQSNLGDATFSTSYTKVKNKVRNLSFFVYTYNVLGEYSEGFQVAQDIPEPSVKNLVVDETVRDLKFVFVGATGALVEVAEDAAFQHITFAGVIGGQSLYLSDSEFFPTRYFRVYAYDDIGQSSVPQTLTHSYQAQGVSQFDGTEVSSVSPPSTPTTDPIVPTNVQNGGWSAEFINHSWRNYGVNRFRYE